MERTGAKRFYLPSADYIWPHVLNERVTEAVTANGGEIVGEEYFPLDHTDYAATVERITASGADVVFNTIVPPGLTPFFEELHDSGFVSRGGQLVCTYMDENFLNLMPAAHCEGLYSCLDYYQAVEDPFSRKLLAQYDALYPGEAKFTGGSACSGLYRGLRLWAAAVSEVGSHDQADVIAALDRAEIAEGLAGRRRWSPASTMCASRCTSRRPEAAGSRSSRASARSIRKSAWSEHRLSPADPRVHPNDAPRKENNMLLATTQVEDLDRFMNIFSTQGAEKRKQHGSKGATIFRDPSEEDRVWVIFDWDEQGWQSFVSDPEVPPIMQQAGHKSRPQAAQLVSHCDA